MRRSRAIPGDRILCLHSSSKPHGTCAVHPPFVFARADFVLGGEAGRFGLDLQTFMRYVVGGHRISSAVGMWCHDGSWSDRPGYHSTVPTKEHIDLALRNHARLWRTAGWWLRDSPREEIERIDREYYGALGRR